ncbi:hypothetical protein F1640_21720 [Novosphingobium sp. NBM11]|uniref:hypothetical protein n=1 Tax=Novosphingobium sp. NBM11 TaxID=2596914 RepID=UPI0018927C04|nr:hypothetical protein [Novosphingobium sp. NBM11]MBF5092499.1 hypothetical protein [Novosphingobium sp. NBM11]
MLFIKGNRLAGAPKFVVSLGADVKYPIGDGELKLSVDASHTPGTISGLTQIPCRFEHFCAVCGQLDWGSARSTRRWPRKAWEQ